MTSNKLLRLITTIPLGIIAFLFLMFFNEAHVTMCMTCAIGFSISLAINKNETFNKIASFFAGGIFFYTIYTASSTLLIDWFSGFKLEPSAWFYHFVIDFPLLVMFLIKRDNVDYILKGLEIFMISSPIMFLIQNLFNRELHREEAQLIGTYVAIGAIMLIIHQLIARFGASFYPKLLTLIRKLMIISLIVYTILLLIVIPINLAGPQKDRGFQEPPPDYQGREEGPIFEDRKFDQPKSQQWQGAGKK